MRNRLSCVLLVLCVAAMLAAPAGAARQEAQARKAPASLEERLGEDDGAALAILFGGNMRGNLDLCDCNQPRGGLARRVGYVNAFKKRFPETPVLHVDAGFIFYDSSGYPRYAVLQNDWMLRAFSRWPLDVVNLGRFDLIYARRVLAKEGLEARMKALPVMKNFISANGVFEDSVAAPPPYLVKEVSGPRIKKKLRVGFLGLAEGIRPAGGRDMTVKDIYESARRYVPELRAKCDVLVIVAHAEYETARRLAAENPEADVVIAGNADGLYPPRHIGKTLLVYGAPGNTQQGDLRLYLSPEGKVTFKFLSTDLDALVPADPEANAFAEAARNEIVRARSGTD